MPVPKRIVVVDDDAKVRQLIEYRLRPPEFEFFGFSDGRDALMKLHDIGPDLIVSDIMMPDMDGRLFFQVVKRSPVLKHVPFIFVSAVRASAQVMAVLDAGADAFFVKPFPISQLVARIRGDLCMDLGAGEPAAVGARAAMGVTPLPDAPPAPVPEAPAQEPAAARVPELAASAKAADAREDSAAAPASHATDSELPETSSDDFFDMLLEAQASGEPKPRRVVDASSGGGAGHALPEGRWSTVDVRGRRIQIRTEVRSLPTFAVVTGVTRGDRAIARLETAWQHPLDRIEDRALVRRQIDLQHHQAVGMVEELVVETTPRQVLWGSQERSVDASVLCRAMIVICEQLRAYVGAPTVLGLLRRSHAATSQVRRVLRSFYIRPDGSVWCDRGSARVPHDTVAAVAAWASELLVETARSSERARDLRVRQLTKPMADELERLGFYGAFEGLAEFRGTPGRPAPVGMRSALVSPRGGVGQPAHDQARRLVFPGSPLAEGSVRGEDGVEDPTRPRATLSPSRPAGTKPLFPGRNED